MASNKIVNYIIVIFVVLTLLLLAKKQITATGIMLFDSSDSKLEELNDAQKELQEVSTISGKENPAIKMSSFSNSMFSQLDSYFENQDTSLCKIDLKLENSFGSKLSGDSPKNSIYFMGSYSINDNNVRVSYVKLNYISTTSQFSNMDVKFKNLKKVVYLRDSDAKIKTETDLKGIINSFTINDKNSYGVSFYETKNDYSSIQEHPQINIYKGNMLKPEIMDFDSSSHAYEPMYSADLDYFWKIFFKKGDTLFIIDTDWNSGLSLTGLSPEDISLSNIPSCSFPDVKPNSEKVEVNT